MKDKILNMIGFKYKKDENLNQLLYFIIAILVVGSIGIWLPPLLELKVDLKALTINLTTFFTSILVAGSMDFILKRIDTNEGNLKFQLLKTIGGLLVAIGWIVLILILTINKWITVPLIMAIIGAIFALWLWWENNLDNPIFNEVIRAEAGSTHGKKW